MKKHGLLFMWFAARILAAPTASDPEATIARAQEMILYSIRPSVLGRVEDDHGNPVVEQTKIERIHDHAVLGKITIRDPQTRQSIGGAVMKILQFQRSNTDASSAGGEKTMVLSLDLGSEFKPTLMCFEPRHAVCFRAGQNHVDVLICFECSNAEFFWPEFGSAGEIQLRRSWGSFGKIDQLLFNRILDANKIERDIPAQTKLPNQSVEPTAPSGRGSP